MKKAYLLAALCCSITVRAQEKAISNYEKVFGDFVRYYNAIKPDSMAKLFTWPSNFGTYGSLEKSHEEWGKIIGFKYIGPFKNEVDVKGNVMMYFKVSFDKKANLKDTLVSRAFNERTSMLQQLL